MKKLLAILLALTMVLCFAACGEGSDDNSGETTAAPVNDLESKYGIDLEAAGEQKLSDDRATMDVLVETRDVWLEGQTAFLTSDKTYEDLAAHIGCDASYYTNMAEDGERHFVWEAEGDATAKFLAVFWETPNGWVLYSVGSTNIG